MATLKSLAGPKGIVIGGGCVDPIHNLHFPASLADGDPGADLMRSEFAQIDLCPWPKDADGDLWTAPGVVDYSGTDAAYAWAVAKGLSIAVVDPAYTSGLLGWIALGGYTASQLTTLLHDYYTAWYSRYPLVDHTSLPNEILPRDYAPWNDEAVGSGGDYCIEWWYRNTDVGLPGGKSRIQFIKTVCQWVKAANPSIRILMNQWGAEGANSSGPADGYAGAYRAWISDLLAAGVPVSGIGVQSHFNPSSGWNATGYGNTLAAYKALGLPVYVTEFDLPNDSGSWATMHHDLALAALDAGVTRFSVWTARDPLWYGAMGALYAADLTPTAARAQVEAALSEYVPPPAVPASLLSRNLMVGR